MSDLYSNDKIRKRAEQLVEREVIYCVSGLIWNLGKLGEDVEKMDIHYEELLDLQVNKNYDDAADYHIDNKMDRQDLIDYLEDQGVDHLSDTEDAETGDNVEGETIERLRELALKAAEEQGWQEFCDEQRIDPSEYESEVYEHWIVSGWLADKLEAKGHTVARDFLGMTIWGRPTTGQAIAMDGVMLEIARDLEEMK